MPIIVDRVKTYQSAKTDAKRLDEEKIRAFIRKLKADKDVLQAEMEANTLVRRAYEDALAEKINKAIAYAGVVMAGFPWIA